MAVLILAIAFALKNLGGLFQIDYCSVKICGLLLRAIFRFVFKQQAYDLY